MKLFRLIALLLIIATFAVFSGCSLNFFSVESLMMPPEQSGENGQIQKAFNRIMQDKIIQLKAPVNGEYQTAFIKKDLDKDGVDEVMVFYSETNTEGTVRIALMEFVDDEWRISVDVKGAGDGIYDVNILDVNNDGVLEVFVSWTLMDSKTTRILSIFEPVKTKNGTMDFKSLGNEYGVAKAFTDFNCDGKTDLIILYIDDTAEVNKAFFRVFSLSEKGDFNKFGEVALDGNITEVLQITSDVISTQNSDYTRVFLDCVKNERMIFTELVYWDSALAAPVRAFANPATTNARHYLLKSSDFDNDGLIEIPEITTLYGDDRSFSFTDEDGIHVMTMIEWTNVKGDSSSEVIKTLFNPKDKYLLEFFWGDKVTVKCDSLREGLVFYLWDNETKKTGKELFSILYRNNNEDNEILGKTLYEAENGTFYYTITPEGKTFGISNEALSDAFTLIQ